MPNVIYAMDLSLNKPDGIYKKGETIMFLPCVSGGGTAMPSGQVKWKLFKNLHTLVDEGVLDLGVPGASVEVIAEEPGFHQCEMTYQPEDGDAVTATIGAAVNPLELRPTWSVPDDFDAFWKRQKDHLATCPLNADLTPIRAKGIKAHDLKVTCVDDVPVSGLFLTPEKTAEGGHPAIISLHGAGVRSANYAVLQPWALEEGFIALDVNAHGIDNLKPRQYYLDLAENELKGYTQRGFFGETPDDIYFVNMFLRVKRAIEFMTSRPEWDGKNLFLIGGSQGAFQTFAGAYLDDRVTAIATGVPAGSSIVDGGWPFSGDAVGGHSPEQLAALRRNAPYVDNASFASKLNIPCYMTVGFIDRACRPDGVYVVHNAYQGSKKIWNGPAMPHAQDQWLWRQCQNGIKENLK